jgi:hypothetical protein
MMPLLTGSSQEQHELRAAAHCFDGESKPSQTFGGSVVRRAKEKHSSQEETSPRQAKAIQSSRPGTGGSIQHPVPERRRVRMRDTVTLRCRETVYFSVTAHRTRFLQQNNWAYRTRVLPRMAWPIELGETVLGDVLAPGFFFLLPAKHYQIRRPGRSRKSKALDKKMAIIFPLNLCSKEEA